MQIVDITSPDGCQDGRDLRLRRHPGRRAGLPPGRQAGARVRRLRVGHVRRRHVDVLPRGAGARLRRPQGRRHRQERHVHRRADEPARAEDGLVRRRRAGHAQPLDPPERQVPLQLELRPHHVGAAGDRDLRHLGLRRPAQGPRARAADPPGPRHRVARHHLQHQGRPRVLRRPLAGRDHQHRGPGAPDDRLDLPRPVDQRLAPDGPVHDDRLAGQRSASS